MSLRHRPDRWDDLPASVTELPGLFSHLLAFSAGPRVSFLVHLSLVQCMLICSQSCVGVRMSLIELKCFLFTLVTHFAFTESENKIGKANV